MKREHKRNLAAARITANEQRLMPFSQIALVLAQKEGKKPLTTCRVQQILRQAESKILMRLIEVQP